ncbi:MAG: hypothetical protein CBB68_05345 [Rhodospirillaceae bacterium TMED8]|nr:hypothetical protein [Magnetovibrio sp.]OUT51420.1 MAG: hypothetical protein CBB68_05345 [Rhodospirillaceae bacterium TMED8]|tara:strand:- start:1225 stop:1782 length:558 start_codon:yes stop_codon:yes gene_type:complete
MTANYNPMHDRILFRVSTQKRLEYRVWLTRRVVKNLWAIAIRSFEADADFEADVGEDEKSGRLPHPQIPKKQEPRIREAVMSMKHQEALQSSDFSKKHDTKTMPAPEVRNPLLVIKAEIGRTVEGTIKLNLHTLERKNVTLSLNDKTLHALCHMLQRASDKAEWNLELRVGNAGNTFMASTHVLN